MNLDIAAPQHQSLMCIFCLQISLAKGENVHAQDILASFKLIHVRIFSYFAGSYLKNHHHHHHFPTYQQLTGAANS